MKTKIITLIATLITSLSLSAITINHDAFYNDYLNNKVENWGPKIDQILKQESKLTDRNMLELSNYLYGYIAVVLENKDEDAAENYIERWEPILDKMEEKKALREYAYVYKGAMYAYKISLSKIKAMWLGKRSLNSVEDALEINPKNPLAVGLMGNMKFYIPKAFGGDKHKSIEYYKKALSLFPTNIDPLFRWNRCGLLLCLAQAYEKTNQKDKAMETVNKMLQIAPNFKYANNVFLPQLLQDE